MAEQKSHAWPLFFLLLLAVFGLCCGLPCCGARAPRGPAPPPSAEGGQPTGTPAAWRVQSEKSPIDDSTTVAGYVYADAGYRDWLGLNRQPKLVVRCQENKTEAYVDFGGSLDPELGRYNEATLTLRVDEEKAFEVRASKSTDSKAAFFPNAIKQLKQLQGKKRLLVRFVPFKSPPADAVFDLNGIDEVIGQVSAACNWQGQPRTQAKPPKASPSPAEPARVEPERPAPKVP